MKEDAGSFTPLDPEKIFPVSSKLKKSKSVSKMNFSNKQEEAKSRISSIIKQNRPKPLIKSKYVTTTPSDRSPAVTSSLPQIKSSMMSSIPKASKSARKFFSKRSPSSKRRLIKTNLY